MRALAGLAALLAGVALAGCSGPPPAAPVRAQAVVALSAETGIDIGDGRPKVTYDGLMVRRRVVIAVHPRPKADLVDIRRRLNRKAATAGVTLSTVPASVLDAAELEHLVPELIVALPIGQPIEVANRIVDPAIRCPGVDHFHVDSVLVHDLRFEVTAADPERVRAAIDREGILADALGRYTSEVGTGLVRISYTGPLLSDDLVQRVQDGVARGAGTTRDQVRVGPRSTLGVGVDMAKEPQEAVAEDHDQGEAHDHH